VTDDASWLTDQIKAAAADASQRLASSGPVQHVQPGRDRAIGQLRELLLRQLDAGLEGQCGHLPPRVIQRVHWLPASRTCGTAMPARNGSSTSGSRSTTTSATCASAASGT
jgi:hypothetical protein